MLLHVIETILGPDFEQLSSFYSTLHGTDLPVGIFASLGTITRGDNRNHVFFARRGNIHFLKRLARLLHRRIHRQRVSQRGLVMTTTDPDRSPFEEPLAELERHLIGAYLAGTGEDLQDLLTRHDDHARKLLADASRYASDKLAEVEARSHYLRQLHGEP
jgi:hypothetical protein